MLNYMQDQIRISSTTSLSAMKMARPLLVIAVSPLLLRRQETIRNLCESSCPTLSDFSDPNPWNFSTCGCASACCAQGCFLIKLYAVPRSNQSMVSRKVPHALTGTPVAINELTQHWQHGMNMNQHTMTNICHTKQNGHRSLSKLHKAANKQREVSDVRQPGHFCWHL